MLVALQRTTDHLFSDDAMFVAAMKLAVGVRFYFPDVLYQRSTLALCAFMFRRDIVDIAMNAKALRMFAAQGSAVFTRQIFATIDRANRKGSFLNWHHSASSSSHAKAA
jgi:hypothetical protein